MIYAVSSNDNLVPTLEIIKKNLLSETMVHGFIPGKYQAAILLTPEDNIIEVYFNLEMVLNTIFMTGAIKYFLELIKPYEDQK